MRYAIGTFSVIAGLVAAACTSPAVAPGASPAACSATTGGIRGDLVFVGGPYTTASPPLEPGSVRVYCVEAKASTGTVRFSRGHGFEIGLQPGRYRLEPRSGDAICEPLMVTVGSNRWAVVHVRCDVR